MFTGRNFRGTDPGKAVLFWKQSVQDTFERITSFVITNSDYVTLEYSWNVWVFSTIYIVNMLRF